MSELVEVTFMNGPLKDSRQVFDDVPIIRVPIPSFIESVFCDAVPVFKPLEIVEYRVYPNEHFKGFAEAWISP